MTASPDDHLDQARRNLEIAEYLLQEHGADPTYVQWAVTAIFYCAVHCVQAHLMRYGRAPRTHEARGRLIADPQYGVPIDVQTAYELLSAARAAARCAGSDISDHLRRNPTTSAGEAAWSSNDPDYVGR